MTTYHAMCLVPVHICVARPVRLTSLFRSFFHTDTTAPPQPWVPRAVETYRDAGLSVGTTVRGSTCVCASLVLSSIANPTCHLIHPTSTCATRHTTPQVLRHSYMFLDHIPNGGYDMSELYVRDKPTDRPASWHPGPHGHILRADILAYNYLGLLGDAIECVPAFCGGSWASIAPFCFPFCFIRLTQSTYYPIQRQ